MANILLVAGHVWQEHLHEAEFKIYEKHGLMVDGTIMVPFEYRNAYTYIALEGLDDEIDVEGTINLIKFEGAMRAKLIGFDIEGKPHHVIGVLRGVNTKQSPGDFEWAFDDDTVLSHYVARIGEDNTPWVEIESKAPTSV